MRYLSLVLTLVVSTCAGGMSAWAQEQQGVMRMACVRADQLGALVGTNDPKRTPIMVDDDGDAWMVLENETTGLKVLGFLSTANKAFCAAGIKGTKSGGPPQRGA